MILLSEIQTAYELQQLNNKDVSSLINRLNQDLYSISTKHIEVITGIRRSGKSTLLRQLQRKFQTTAYFNFEDPRIFSFEVSDFPKLGQIMGEAEAYFFDEIQNIPKWELFIRNLHDKGKKIFITGSNAEMLSSELGTRLTGRYLRKEIFTFSYQEFLLFNNETSSIEHFSDYLHKGGFPEFLQYSQVELLQQLVKDIVYRDVCIRYGIRNTQTVMDLTLYLLSNVSKELSFNNLRKTLHIASTNSVADYVHWLEESYLVFLVPRFSWSLKQMLINPKKLYAIDNGLIQANTLSFSVDKGRMLENAVFLYLKQKFEKVYYFKDKNECDFVVFNANACKGVFQVCYEVTTDNQTREFNGLVEAMNFFNLTKGIIITYNQNDQLTYHGKEIELVSGMDYFI